MPEYYYYFQTMIEWNFENTYYFAAIVSSMLMLVIYFLFMRKEVLP
ncbi:MAG: hypothetical protein FJ044_02855 [Candidatus Cloacimonetes bacterium]|nr:hypothetical protein [Candidatus Cloacimonadota bacterium]